MRGIRQQDVPAAERDVQIQIRTERYEAERDSLIDQYRAADLTDVPGAPYAEVQIHGGNVGVTDIDRVVFRYDYPESSDRPRIQRLIDEDRSLKRNLERLGIPWTSRGEPFLR